MRKLAIILKKILYFIVLITIILTAIILCRLYIPQNAYTNIDYCVDIARKINWIGLSHFECATIRDNQDVVLFRFTIKNEYIQHTDDELLMELIEIKNYMVEYMKEHPENELNSKKINLYFSTLPGDYMCVYNYDFISGAEFVDAKDFVYFDKLDVDNISVLQGLNDARIMNVLGVRNVDSLDFFREFTALRYLGYYSHNISEEEKGYLQSILPNCIIEFTRYSKN